MFYLKRIQKIARIIVILFFGTTIFAVVLYKFVPVYYTPLMFIRCFQQKANGEEVKLSHHWVPLEEMSRYMPVAVMASEDQLFLEHHGFSWKGIELALEERRSGKRFRGGSTISQQTAKNVFLWPNSTWVRKGFEAYFTVLIELIWGKERIMEVYLNSIEMGPGIYGADAVAVEHFNTTAENLSRRQCALIAATLPAPLRYSSLHPSAYMLKRQKAIMVQMKYIDLFPVTKHE
jgi:monofunctional biosynthetic peptidoglycan transglycosylase